MGQGLEESVNPVIVAAVGKSKKLVFEVDTARFSKKENLPVCELFQLDGNASQLITFGNDSDRRKPGGFEILYQRSQAIAQAKEYGPDTILIEEAGLGR